MPYLGNLRPFVLVLLLTVASTGATGCGAGDDPAPQGRPAGDPGAAGAAGAVDLDLDLDLGATDAPGPAGPPDAGTATGHGADEALLRSDGPVGTVRGRVDPADSTVRLTGPAGADAVRVGPDGRFTGRVAGLRPGANRVRIEATRAGRAGRSREIRILRQDSGPVVGAVEVPRSQRAPLALSARAGYGGVAHVARVDGAAHAVRGSVEPADSRVTVLDTRTGATVRARVDRRGAFVASLRSIRPGASAFVVAGARAGRLRWVENLLLVRGGAPIEPPASVTVPDPDRTPPVAIMRLERTGPAGRVEAFTETQSSPARPVVLRGTTLRGAGEMRDADGGALRVRVTVTADLFCRDATNGQVRRLRKLWRRPPAAIERLVVPPGRRLPTVLRRPVRIDLVGSDCAAGRVERVDGQVEADATNASELEEATPIYFSARP